ncbi:MAG: 3-phosphoshikimate 1-carboxyvinyltransferase [Bacteroidetes bacterium]|nr:3-phosphoshikimate 1-carboxyvinyltransferase [Bacteroidota bacterium]
MKFITISKPDKTLKGSIMLPASKSISARLLMIQSLCNKNFSITNLSKSDDTVLLQRLLESVAKNKESKKVVELDAANAGTAMRFLTAYLSVTPGKWMLTGSDRMKQRPIGILTDALNNLGASIDYLGKPGYPPLLIEGCALSGKEVTIDPGVSSQFTSALSLIAPFLPNGLTLNLKGKLVSSPYMMMTVNLMQQYGIKVNIGKAKIQIKPGMYIPIDFNVESDWSAAAFWYEAAVFATEVDLILEGLQLESLQGDAVLPEVFQNFGIKTEYSSHAIRLTKVSKKIDGFFYDFSDNPDIAQPVIATCAGLGIRGRFEGIQSLLIKETDRIRAMKNELEKLNIRVITSGRPDDLPFFELKPSKPVFPEGLCFETYSDHRMAMTLAPFALKTNSLKIRNPDVVIKSYPDFWEHLKLLGFILQTG